MDETGKPAATDKVHLNKSRIQEILALPVSEKIELAQTGSRELRVLLARDSNTQVQEAVINSPRITEVEVVAIARSAKIGPALLSKIAAKRDWLKNYQVRLALVSNPKTPLPLALKLLTTLRDADLTGLAKSKVLPEELVVAAERTIAQRAPATPQQEKDEKRAKSRYQEIRDLPVPEKVKLAMSGDKEARSILIKDSNKQIQEAVLDSPRITEPEIVAIANSRNVGEELLRKIASNRDWMKNYQVRIGLANNPKTPLTIGLRIIGTLMISDLKRLSKSKGVSSVLSAAANRFLIKKGVK
ncbi:MAG: hypothetical protein JSU80_06450 [Deltaproteobacteria bacterium]|nr:MAG: hypothetical protein JSU80_06450 [Deltaproteobacteria bacterium]